MVWLAALVAILSFFEIRWMARDGKKKEIAVYIIIAAAALALGYITIKTPGKYSFADMTMKIFKIRH